MDLTTGYAVALASLARVLSILCVGLVSVPFSTSGCNTGSCGNLGSKLCSLSGVEILPLYGMKITPCCCGADSQDHKPVLKSHHIQPVVPTAHLLPETPFSTAPMASKHISPNANTSNPLFKFPNALKTHFTQCQHLTRPFQLPPCHQNIFHPMQTPQTPFSTPLMPSKHISPSANTSNPLFNCPHALKTYFTQCQHLKPPFQLPPCPQNIFHPVPTPQTPFSTAPMPSKHISPNANTSNPLFNCPHALKA